MKNYSQYGEDLIISEYFQGRVGTFLDLGANDGITLSNTYLLYQKNWKGLMVEGSPFVYQRLFDLFSQDENIQTLNICLSEKNGIVDFFHNTNHHVNPNIRKDNMDLLSTIDMNSYERTKEWGHFEKIQIECFTFEKVMELSKFDKFDLISIDIEGMDFKILNQIELDKTSTECIVIEYNGDKEEKDNIIKYCSKFGLDKILLDNKINLIIAK